MTAAAPATPDTGDKLDAAVLKISGVVVLGAIMSILDVTVVNIAQTTFQSAFGVNAATAAWTATGYTLALATVIPLTGWAADRFGTKRLYMLALLLFICGSAACACAWNIGSLIGFRVLQGLGGGALMPLGMTIMTRAAGPTRIGRVMAVLGVPMLLGPIGGPILGGWLIQVASWHWIFLINLPIGVIALLFAWRILPKDEPHPSERFDFLGMLLLSPGLALFLYGVSTIPSAGTVTAAKVWIPAVIGIVLIAAFLVHALGKRDALIDLQLFRNRQLSVSVGTLSLFAIAFFGAMLLMPQYFILVRHKETLATGLLLIPQGLGAMVTMPISGRLTDKVGPGRFVLGGIVLIAAGMAVFTQVGANTSYLLLEGSLFVMGLGMGATMMPIMTAALATLTHHEVARGSTLMNIVQQTAGSIGTAVMSVVLTSQYNAHPAAHDYLAALQVAAEHPGQPPVISPTTLAAAPGALASSYGGTFWVALALILACFIPALLLPRHKAQLTGEQLAELAAEGDEAPPPVMMH